MTAKFNLGDVFITPGARDALSNSTNLPFGYLLRHQMGDFGDLDDEDKATNEEALKLGNRIFSAYHLEDGTKIWIITEADRSSTTILLPEEY